MNDLSAKSMLRLATGYCRPALILTFLVTTGAGIAGCADFRRAVTLPPVNPESPVASAVIVGSRRNFPMPGFTNVPPSPRNVPPAPAVKTAVFAMVGCRRTFEAWERDHPAMVSDTAPFAAVERAKVDLNPADVPTATDDKASQAYAASLKAYASPPAALPSGPPPSASELVPPPPKDASSAPPAKTASAPPPKPARARPARAVAAAAPQAVAPASTTVAPVDVRAPTLALAPPPPPGLADPLLAHCQ